MKTSFDSVGTGPHWLIYVDTFVFLGPRLHESCDTELEEDMGYPNIWNPIDELIVFPPIMANTQFWNQDFSRYMKKCICMNTCPCNINIIEART
jgi:hypothetical protein